jgi:hypothetical protein
MITDRAKRLMPSIRKSRFVRDRRGAVAFEMIFVYSFLLFSLLLPLADMAVAGFQFISAWQALRALGQSIQYSPPPDVTSTTSWSSTATGKADSRYPISAIQVMCGDAKTPCSAGNLASPKYYSYTTSLTLTPMVLKSVLCTSTGANPCTFTLPYSERFQ